MKARRHWQRIVLTDEQLFEGILVGARRAAVAIEQQRPSKSRRSALERYVYGTLAEYVVAISLGVEWVPNVGGSDRLGGDVAGYEVKWTGYDGPGIGLTVRPRENARGRRIVLVLGGLRVWRIVGWITSDEAEQPRYRHDLDRRLNDKPYLVPVEVLHHWPPAEEVAA